MITVCGGFPLALDLRPQPLVNNQSSESKKRSKIPACGLQSMDTSELGELHIHIASFPGSTAQRFLHFGKNAGQWSLGTRQHTHLLLCQVSELKATMSAVVER